MVRNHTNHFSKSHSQLRFTCDICEKQYKNIGNIKEHYKHVHDRMKTVTCNYCGKGFRKVCQMKTHVSVLHEGKKDYECVECGKKFAWLKGLQIHLVNVHQLKDDKTCHICGKTYPSRGVKNQHIGLTHKSTKTLQKSS